MRCIVNADDFGYSESRTNAICECFRRGWVHQTSLMVTMPDCDRAVALARQEGFADRVGLHLNLSEGRPLTAELSNMRRFCNEDGTFRRRQLGSKLFSSHEREVVRKELEAQVARYCDYGLKFGRCDGHNHCEARIPVALLLMPLLKRYGFKSVRGGNVRPLYESGMNLYLSLRRKFYDGLARWNGLSRDVQFFGCYCKESRPVLKQLWRSASQPGMVVELMTHPEYNKQGKIVDSTDYLNLTGPEMAAIAADLSDKCRAERGAV